VHVPGGGGEGRCLRDLVQPAGAVVAEDLFQQLREALPEEAAVVVPAIKQDASPMSSRLLSQNLHTDAPSHLYDESYQEEAAV
jgi:hypothetical protein